MKVKQFIKQETVLSVAIVLAAISAVFVPPDAGYISYIDLRTLAILFSLMTVMAGLRRQCVFDRLGRALLGQTNSTLQLVLVLAGLCFFGSMLITNDVSLLTFASMASLISYRQIAREVPEDKSRYFKLFSASNLIFLAILLTEWWIIRQ